MASTPESKVKERVKRILKKYGCYQFWPVQTGYAAATIYCLGCCQGAYFAIETKAPGKRPTARQQLTIQDMRKAGAVVFVIGEYKQGDKIYPSVDDRPFNDIRICEEEYSGLGALEAWILMIKRL